MLSYFVWDFYKVIVQKVNPFILSVWTGYCQYIRPARFAVKHQIFLPALIVMVTLMTEGAPPLVTYSLTAASVIFFRLSLRVSSYDLMMHQSYLYWIPILIPYFLKPVLIVVLALTPVLSENRILVTGIIVVLVQLSQLPTFCVTIQLSIVQAVVVLFVMGTTSSSGWIWLSVCVFSATFFKFNAYVKGITLVVTTIIAQSALLAATVNLSWGFLTASVIFPVLMFLVSLSVYLPEGKLLTSTLVLGLVMNVVLTKFGIIDIMVLLMAVAIILEASTAPLLIRAASKFECTEL